MKKKYFPIVFFVCLVSLVHVGVFAEELPWDFSTEMETVSQKLLSLFPKVEVYVIAKDGRNIVLDNSKSELSAGMVLGVIKSGKQYTHPITGEVLGSTEELVCKILINTIQGSLALATPLEERGGELVKRGQKARITSAKLRVLLSNIKNGLRKKYETDDLRSVMVTKLEKTSRFDVISMVDIYYKLKELGAEDMKKLYDHDIAKKVAASLKADILIECELKQFGRDKFIEYRVFIPGTEKPFYKSSVKLKEKVSAYSSAAQGFSSDGVKKRETGVVSQLSGLEAPGSSARSQKLDYGIVSMQIGDVTGDGAFNVVTTDGSSIRVYNRESGSIKLIWEESGSHSKQISVELVDLNGNGIDEIYVTRFRTSPSAYAFEYVNGTFKKIMDSFPRFLRSMLVSGQKGKRLFGQKMSGLSVFHSSIERYEWGTVGSEILKVVDEIPIPSNASIYGCAFGAITDGKSEQIIFYNNSEHLEIYNVGARKTWESSEVYGGSTLTIEAESKKTTIIDDRYGLINNTGGKGKTRIPPRVILRDTDKNASPEVVTYKNVSLSGRLLSNMPLFDKSMIIGLEYDGIGLGKKWFTRELDAVAVDFDLLETSDGEYTLAVALKLKNTEILSLGSSQSVILFYNRGS